MLVAMEAPATPQSSTTISRKSSTMFVIPAISVIQNPRRGFSAVTNRIWNMYCSMKHGTVNIPMIPYTMQEWIICCSTPSRPIIGLKTKMPIMPIRIPKPAQVYTKNENSPFASSGFCSPSVFPIMAEPPVPTISPNTPRTANIGNVIFTDAKATLPTKLEINNPSTIPYTDRKIMFAMVGRTKIVNLLYVK